MYSNLLILLIDFMEVFKRSTYQVYIYIYTHIAAFIVAFFKLEEREVTFFIKKKKKNRRGGEK